MGWYQLKQNNKWRFINNNYNQYQVKDYGLIID